MSFPRTENRTTRPKGSENHRVISAHAITWNDQPNLSNRAHRFCLSTHAAHSPNSPPLEYTTIPMNTTPFVRSSPCREASAMLSRRAKLLFWAAIAAVLALGLGRLLAYPTQPSDASSSPVIITEFAASNGGELADEDGDYPDWIELHNRSARPVNLEGWTLTDDPTQPDKWTFRPITLAKRRTSHRLRLRQEPPQRLKPEEGRTITAHQLPPRCRRRLPRALQPDLAPLPRRLRVRLPGPAARRLLRRTPRRTRGS